MIEIRSFRRVFDLERRLYSIDRFRLNPAGVPVRGVLYCLSALVATLVLSMTPVVGALTRSVPWYLRDLIVPAAVAAGASMVRVDGRTFHLAVRGAMTLTLSPRRVTRLMEASPVGARWLIPDLVSFPDGSDPSLRRLRYEGPGAVLIQIEHTRTGASEYGRVGLAKRAAALRITGPANGQRLARGQVIALEAGSRLTVEPR